MFKMPRSDPVDAPRRRLEVSVEATVCTMSVPRSKPSVEFLLRSLSDATVDALVNGNVDAKACVNDRIYGLANTLIHGRLELLG
jgi:hypothetical protein